LLNQNFILYLPAQYLQALEEKIIREDSGATVSSIAVEVNRSINPSVTFIDSKTILVHLANSDALAIQISLIGDEGSRNRELQELIAENGAAQEIYKQKCCEFFQKYIVLTVKNINTELKTLLAGQPDSKEKIKCFYQDYSTYALKHARKLKQFYDLQSPLLPILQQKDLTEIEFCFLNILEEKGNTFMDAKKKSSNCKKEWDKLLLNANSSNATDQAELLQKIIDDLSTNGLGFKDFIFNNYLDQNDLRALLFDLETTLEFSGYSAAEIKTNITSNAISWFSLLDQHPESQEQLAKDISAKLLQARVEAINARFPALAASLRPKILDEILQHRSEELTPLLELRDFLQAAEFSLPETNSRLSACIQKWYNQLIQPFNPTKPVTQNLNAVIETAIQDITNTELKAAGENFDLLSEERRGFVVGKLREKTDPAEKQAVAGLMLKTMHLSFFQAFARLKPSTFRLGLKSVAKWFSERWNNDSTVTGEQLVGLLKMANYADVKTALADARNKKILRKNPGSLIDFIVHLRSATPTSSAEVAAISAIRKSLEKIGQPVKTVLEAEANYKQILILDYFEPKCDEQNSFKPTPDKNPDETLKKNLGEFITSGDPTVPTFFSKLLLDEKKATILLHLLDNDDILEQLYTPALLKDSKILEIFAAHANTSQFEKVLPNIQENFQNLNGEELKSYFETLSKALKQKSKAEYLGKISSVASGELINNPEIVRLLLASLPSVQEFITYRDETLSPQIDKISDIAKIFEYLLALRREPLNLDARAKGLFTYFIEEKIISFITRKEKFVETLLNHPSLAGKLINLDIYQKLLKEDSMYRRQFLRHATPEQFNTCMKLLGKEKRVSSLDLVDLLKNEKLTKELLPEDHFTKDAYIEYRSNFLRTATKEQFLECFGHDKGVKVMRKEIFFLMANPFLFPQKILNKLSAHSKTPIIKVTEESDSEQNPGDRVTEESHSEQNPGDRVTEESHSEQNPGNRVLELRGSLSCAAYTTLVEALNLELSHYPYESTTNPAPSLVPGAPGLLEEMMQLDSNNCPAKLGEIREPLSDQLPSSAASS
jgi:hypothetical protein